MKKTPKHLAKSAMALLVTTSLAGGIVTVQAASTPQTEKCYGIAKKGKNDCGTSHHACAGQSATDGAKDEWIYVMKGNCRKIAGGRLKPR